MSKRWMAWLISGALGVTGVACGESSEPTGDDMGNAFGTNGTTGNATAGTGSGTTGGSGTSGFGSTSGSSATGVTGTGGAATGLGSGGSTGGSSSTSGFGSSGFTGTSGAGTSSTTGGDATSGSGSTGLATTGGSTGLATTGGSTGLGSTGGSTGTSGGGGSGFTGFIGTAGNDGGSSSGGSTGATAGAGCTPAPTGTFRTVRERGGPNGDYPVFRPANLGEGGFKHPPIAWGNGVTTTADLYVDFLQKLASQGFVVIAEPGVLVTAAAVRQGLEWLIAQDKAAGPYAGNLATNCAGTIGYSMGGGSAVGAGAHPAVKAIVSVHGLPDASARASGPILLTTSEGDNFVTKAGFVVPGYTSSSRQPTILASHRGGDHLDPLFTLGQDADPAIAWLRYWIYGDQSQRDWFFGANCKLCSWPDIRRKNYDWD